MDAGELRPRERTALGALAVRRGHPLARDELADALWGDEPPPSWPKQVQICVARLRKLLGTSAIVTTQRGYVLALTEDELDVNRFEMLVERGRTLAATGEPDRAASTLAGALALWRGRPFEDLDGWAPAQSEAARLDEIRRAVEEDLLDARLAAGEHREVAAEAELLVGAEPLRERRWAILALAQYRCGRQADALRLLQRARRTLVEQLGIEPGAELAALEAAVLRQDPALNAVCEPAAVTNECPYKGLAPYDVDDAESFFGRDAEVAKCLDRLRTAPLLVVAGPSGCGKSSLVRAGLVPALKRQGQAAVVFVPGEDPAAALATATATASTTDTPVLVIDQFEELFALGMSIDGVRAFCEQIVAYATGRATVIIAVRADHLAGLGVDAGLRRLAEQTLHLLSPLTGDELRAAIEQPASQAGLRLEQGLVDLLVRDTDGEPGALPLLSHALAETWRRRDGHVLTVEGYRATGGIRGAVARSADRLHDSLPPDERATLRAVLLRLVTPATGGEPVRCRVASRTLMGDPGRERVVALLVRSRLVTSEADTFELAHEALARAWPRLQSWLDEDADGQRILRHLGAAADGWDSLGRPASELYRGARLDTALEWRDAAHPELNELERAFLDASAELASGESQALAARARRDVRQNRRLRWLLVATAVLLVGALVAGLLAVRGGQQAENQRDAAQRERRVASARELAAAATANLGVDPERSVLLALAAVEATRSADGFVLPEVEEALHRAVSSSRVEFRVAGVGGHLDWSPDGATFVTEGQDSSGVVDIRDARTGESVRSFRGHDVDVTDVAFNHDGTMLATTGEDGAARIWDPRTGDALHTVSSPDGTAAWGPSFSTDGTLFAAAWPAEDLVIVFDVTTGEIVREIRSVPGPARTAFGPGGERVAISSTQEPVAAVIDVPSGNTAFELEGHLHYVNDVAWSPDGASIATAGVDSSTRVYDAATGAQRFVLFGHGSHVNTVEWSPDSTRLVTASEDGTAVLWLLIEGDGRELARLSAQSTRSGILGVAFAPDGGRIITGDESNTTTSWDVSIAAGAEIANVPAVSFFYSAARFTPDGRHLIATGGAGSINVWDARTFTRVRAIGAPAQPMGTAIGTQPIGGDDATRVEVSPDGQLVGALRELERLEGVVHVWDIASGREAFATRAGFEVTHLAWSPDGEYLALAGGGHGSGTTTVLDRSGREVTTIEQPGVWFNSVAFSPDGESLILSVMALGRYDPSVGRAEIWDWRAGEVVGSLDAEPAYAVPDPTGTLIATAAHAEAESQRVEIWDAATGELVSSLDGHTGAVLDLAFDAPGSRLATVSGDGTIRLWDSQTGEQLLVLYGHLGGLATSVTFSPDGSQLATAGADGTVRVWALDLDELLTIAERKVTRNLTDDECRRYLHADRCP